MTRLAVTVDLDWACEPAVEETLDFLQVAFVVTSQEAARPALRTSCAVSSGSVSATAT